MTEHQPVGRDELSEFITIHGISADNLGIIHRHIAESGEHLDERARQILETGGRGYPQVLEKVAALSRAHEMAVLKGEISILDLTTQK